MRLGILLASVLLLSTGCQAPAGDGRTVIRFATSPDKNQAVHHRIAAFEALHPNLKIDLLEMPASSDTQHNQFATYLIAEDSTVDVYAIDVVWPAEFGSAGWAEPLEDRRTKEDWAGYLQGPLQACRYHGHIWAIPWYCDAGLLYYRKDLLDAQHLSPPQTWDDLKDECLKLQHPPELYGYAGQWAQYEGLVCNFLELVWGNGGDILSNDGRIVTNSDTNVQAVDTMVDWLRRAKITSPEINVDKEDESLNLFLAGRSVFCRCWPYAWGQCQLSDTSKVKGKVDVCPLPHGPHGSNAACLGGYNLMISKFSRHKDEAWEFVKYMTDDEALKQVYLDCYQLPSRSALFHDPDMLARNPALPRFYQAFLGGHPRPVTPYYSQVSDILQSKVQRALAGELTPAQAMQQAQQDMGHITGLSR